MRLPREEEKVYFDVASGRFEPIDKEDILLATGALAKIYFSGKSSCGHVFREMVRKFMRPLLKKVLP